MSFAKALIEQGFRSDLFLAKDRQRDAGRIVPRSCSDAFPEQQDKAKSDKRDRSGDAQGLKNADLNPGWIELVPCQSMPRRSRVRVMIIVPTFSERDEGNPPVVTGIVPCQEPA
jgi:hypothetical protein